MTDLIKDLHPPLLELRGVSKKYAMTSVLDNMSFTVERGGIVGLLGPNGCGKTTVLKLIAGLLTPNSGEILISGEKPSHITAAKIAYLPERNALSLSDRVCDAIDYYTDFFADFDRQMARALAGRLGLSEKNLIGSLSKGNREKLQLILTMSRRAELYLLDEPMGGIDPAARDYILDTILECHAPNSTVIISTHLIADVERALRDVIFISDGKAALCASVASLAEKHGKTVDEIFREVYKC